MDVREKYVMQKVNRKEKSICPNCIHHNLCIAENNQPCFECNRFIDAHGVTVQEWISVKDRLPEDNSNVIACLWIGKESRVYPAFYAHGVWWDRVFSTPTTNTTTHWQSMPQPPKGE